MFSYCNLIVVNHHPSQPPLGSRVSVIIMPPLTPQIRPNLIICLRILQHLHINICNSHALRTSTQLTQRPHKWHRNLAQATESKSWRPASVGEDDC